MIICGDHRIELKGFKDNCVSSVVTDPPYGLSFMGKRWDYNVPSVGDWAEVYRVLKPGGFLLAFGGTRTYHRMVVNIEDAGFEIRDQMQWIYGSGFPKSMNVGDGWGTALKPTNEPIVLARKPLSEKTVAGNILKWGTGGINIDGCRIGLSGERPPTGSAKRVFSKNQFNQERQYGENTTTSIKGRFPANVILDEEAARMLDEQTGVLKSGMMQQQVNGGMFNVYGKQTVRDVVTIGDSGGASRFFYCAKAARSERNKGLEHMTAKPLLWSSGTKNPGSFQSEGTNKSSQNAHPTVKPVSLMRYLARLITPSSGIVLDPYNGSGTTGIACKVEGFEYIGIEMDKEHCEVSEFRIAAWEVEKENEDAQLTLF